MSECEVPVAFTRGSRTRASLPVVRSANQTKDRSLGVLYLQYGDETKQIRMPNEITTVDTVQALFVSAFPQQLSMKMLESPSTAIYVKDDLRNMYYELSDVRSITDQSCLKVYHKDPVHAFSHAARPSSGEARMHRETMYTSRDAPPLMRQTSNSPSMSPTSHSITSLPSRIPFGPRSSGGGATMSRERAGHPLATPTRSASPSPSAILERRDVKPDEDLSAKAMGRGGEGIYGDPFLLHHNSPTSETLDQGYHRASIRSYGMTMEPTEHHSLFRQKSWKTPPSSPHRMGEMRMTDIQASQSQSPLTIERSSPVRQSFRKEGPIAVEKAKNAMGSHVATDLQGHGLLVQPGEPQTRDRPMKSGSPVHSISSTGGSSPVLGTKIASESSTNPTPPNGTVSLQVNLSHFRRNISGLRLQLQQMRQLQLQNQECVRAQIKQAEQEISARLAEVLRRQEDPAQRQRALVEEERHKYLSMEESVLTQLGDLEQYVESVRRDSSSATAARPITLKEVEEGAVGLRKVGESLAALKGDFPVLQGRMRAVLRVEVEAVKFLKEEPHKLDSMLKRVKSLTETLSTLRRNATEGLLKPDSVITTMVDEAVAVPPAELHSTVPLFEPQRSSLSSEAVNSKTLVPQCTQRSFPPTPELPTKTSNTQKVEICSAAQPELAAPLSSSGGLPLSIARCNGSSSSETSNLFIEEIISHSKGKNRAPSIEAAEKEWEEKRQSLSHYDGLGFEKMLQEAEAKMLRGIPIMEGAVDGIRPSPAAAPPLATEERVENPKPSALQTQEDKQPDPPSFEKSTKTGSDKAPKLEKATKAALGKPVMPNLSIKSSMERQPKSKDKATKTSQSSEKASKSPPPPPPRRNYINSTGVTSTRSGEVIYGSRKESGSAQEVEVDVQNPASRHAPRSPLEVKPKPCTPLPVTASANLEEEDEGNKIMAELQNAETQENKDLVMDENGNNAIRQNAGVIYYVTAQISKESPEESTDNRAASQSSPSQVSKVNTYEKSQNKLLVSPDGLSGVHYPDNIWSLPSDLPHTPLTRSSSLKTKKQDPGSPTQGKVHVVKVPQVQLSIEETVESPTAICTPVSLGRPDLIHPKAPAIYGELTSANPRQEFSVNKTREKFENVDDESETFLSPDLPGEEPPPPPPDNIAFMITNTKVQALSTGEYRDLVKAKKGNVQTVTVGSKPQNKHGSDISTVSSNGFDDAENSEFSKKPVIIIFDEPMDIRLAYKRLSTIFECEEELERMLTKERIEEESEETEDEDKTNVQDGNQMNSGKAQNGANLVLPSSLLSDGGTGTQATTDPKQDVKKKFKFKFPKKQLAALTQAIRTGTKTGKKTLQVVVYEDEEESDGTIKQHKETKRFEISCSKEDNLKSESTAQEPHGRTEEIRKSAYKTLDSLEQTIKQLETTISEMGPKSSDDLLSTKSTAVSSKLRARQGAEALDKVVPQKALVTKSSSSSKRPSLRKKPKPQLLPRPAGSNTTGVSVNPAPPQQNVSVASPTSRMPVPMSAKTRQQLGTSDRERATKQLKLQDSQRQFRQANGSAKRSGGDPKSTSPTMSASKIPAFSTNAGKGTSQPDATNPVNHSVVPSSSSSSSSSSKSSIPNPRSIPNSSSHIPSLSNGSIKHAQSTHNTKTLSLSTQTQNGRYSSSSSSSSSHSPLSPTMLSQVSKSIRTIHTPSFVSYTRPHSGNSGKSAIPTATSTKDAS